MLISRLADEEISYSTNELHSGTYHLAGADIRKLDEVESKLTECSTDFKLPTLFLFECVLVYMPVKQSKDLLKFITQKFSNAFCINYEQVIGLFTSVNKLNLIVHFKMLGQHEESLWRSDAV